MYGILYLSSHPLLCLSYLVLSHMFCFAECAAMLPSEQESKWEDVYEEIRAREMAILDTLVDGRALEEHMEDFYLETLRQCVLAVAAATVAKMIEEQDE